MLEVEDFRKDADNFYRFATVTIKGQNMSFVVSFVCFFKIKTMFG